MSYGAVGEEVIASLLVQAKSESRAEWQAAVGQLALRSVSEPLAMQAWSDLMLSYHPEMRLRGVHGLRNLASGQPDQVDNFLRQRFEEEETFQDPVLAQVLVQLLSTLPRKNRILCSSTWCAAVRKLAAPRWECCGTAP